MPNILTNERLSLPVSENWRSVTRAKARRGGTDIAIAIAPPRFRCRINYTAMPPTMFAASSAVCSADAENSYNRAPFDRP
jgi:hypothetical protein